MELSRRTLLLGAAGLAAAMGEGCSPIEILLQPREEGFDRPGGPADRTLRAFVTAVIPGAPAADPFLTAIYFDPRFPFRDIAGYFASHLRSRAHDRFDTSFEFLDLGARTSIIRDGLGGIDCVVARIYQGAIFAAQISHYGGIYGSGGCRLIEFPGPNPGYSPEEQFHARARSLCAPALTLDGNYS
jgi:hypothetical protein